MYRYSFRKNNETKTLLIAVIFIFTCVQSVLAQPNQVPTQQQREVKEDYSKKELKQFIEANNAVTTIQQKNEQKIVATIEEGGMDLNSFNSILTAKQQNKKAENASEDQLKKFNLIIDDVIKIQQEMRQEMTQAIEETGMAAKQYDNMMYAYQNSNTVKQEVNQLIQNNQQE